MIVFIVTILVISQITVFVVSADDKTLSKDETSDTDSKEYEKDEVYDKNDADLITITPYVVGSKISTSRVSKSTGSTSNKEITSSHSNQPVSSIESSSISDASSKTTAYASALMSLESKEKRLDIDAPLKVYTGEVFNVAVTSYDKPIADATVSIVDKKYYTEDDAAKITAPKINGKFLMTAYKEGYQKASKWIAVENYEPQSTSNQKTNTEIDSNSAASIYKEEVVSKWLESISSLRPLFERIFENYLATP